MHDADDRERFQEYVQTRDRRLRNELVEAHMGLAVHIAKRYSRRGLDDDLRQVAMIGLVKAVDRFDPEHGAAFSTFAGRTIEGELKRHFRDATWTLKVPRSAKELHLDVRRASAELEQRLGTSPTVAQIADYLDVDRDDVLRGLAADAASSVEALDTREPDSAIDRMDVLAVHDDEVEQVDHLDQLSDLLSNLSERDRRIVVLRFAERKTQSEIAEIEGISQMHVSRLLRSAFATMRAAAAADAAG
jgi:RNA polymerase sigma-B factor